MQLRPEIGKAINSLRRKLKSQHLAIEYPRHLAIEYQKYFKFRFLDFQFTLIFKEQCYFSKSYFVLLFAELTELQKMRYLHNLLRIRQLFSL